MTNQEPFTWLARIRRPQGRRGEVFADLLTDFPEKFAQRRQLWLVSETPSSSISPRPVELVNHWLHKGGIVLHFAGVDSISGAETLSGLGVAIPDSQRAPLGEGEAYIGDLIGSALIDVSGPAAASIGEIIDVDDTAGPTPLLIVHTAHGEVLIPFAKAYLRQLDLDHKRVEMSLPEGLIDLNA